MYYKIMNKVCSNCKEIKQLHQFRVKSRQCRKCVNKKQRIRMKNKKAELSKLNITKLCLSCNKNKNASKFKRLTVNALCIVCENKKYRKLSKMRHLSDMKAMLLICEKLKCVKCSVIKIISDMKSTKGNIICKKCFNAKYTNIRKNKMAKVNSSKCNSCGITKLIVKMKTMTMCHSCRYKQILPKRIQKKNEMKIDTNIKNCRICNISHQILNFVFSSNKCIGCHRRYKRTVTSRKTRKSKNLTNEQTRAKYQNSESFRFTNLMYKLTRNITKTSKLNEKTLKYICGSKSIFTSWIEYSFDENMTYDNYGIYWQYDHVIPINTFNFENLEEKSICFKWYNVSPLECSHNLSKHDNIDVIQLKTHFDKLKIFTKIATLNNQIIGEVDKYINLYATHLDAGNPSRL